jgi:hypothetical protein
LPAFFGCGWLLKGKNTKLPLTLWAFPRWASRFLLTLYRLLGFRLFLIGKVQTHAVRIEQTLRPAGIETRSTHSFDFLLLGGYEFSRFIHQRIGCREPICRACIHFLAYPDSMRRPAISFYCHWRIQP